MLTKLIRIRARQLLVISIVVSSTDLSALDRTARDAAIEFFRPSNGHRASQGNSAHISEINGIVKAQVRGGDSAIRARNPVTLKGEVHRTNSLGYADKNGLLASEAKLLYESSESDCIGKDIKYGVSP